jgi:hypothetical protein
MDFGVLKSGSLAFFNSLNPSVNKPNLTSLSMPFYGIAIVWHSAGTIPAAKPELPNLKKQGYSYFKLLFP